jgi:iron complex outermembrane receptor protein
MKTKFMTMVALMAAASPSRILAQAPTQSLSGKSLEELLNIEVTSVSKKEQTLAKTAAAVFVISREDIRRSGATNIPDVLRMAPGVEVAQIDGNQWAVSIRGFNSLYSNKVLVLIDGRAIYSSTFSGVFWDQVNVPLEDIERIEVIRGPGGTVWGANAVNGVINIITRSSADTKGGVISSRGGSAGTAEAAAQYGGNAGKSGAYRLFGRYFNTTDSVLAGGPLGSSTGGSVGNDGWHSWQMGFRSDWSPSSQDSLSVQGDFLSSSGGATSAFVFSAPLAELELDTSMTNISGDVLGRWVHTMAGGSEASLQVYDSAMKRHEAGIELTNNTLDVDFEHHLAAGTRHDIVWGFDYRVSRDNLVPTATYGSSVTPAVRVDNLLAAFVQDEIRIARSVFLTVGSKFEHNTYTGFEVEPSAQLVWEASAQHSLWASAAHAVRQPNHVEYGAQFNLAVAEVPGVGSALVTLNGNRNILAERLNDYEVGYRGQLNPKLSLDVTAFLSFYNRLETYEPQALIFNVTGSGPVLALPLRLDNLGHARNYGIEGFAHWNVNRKWEISPGLSVLRMTTGTAATSGDGYLASAPGSAPRFQPQVRSLLNLRKNLEWDSSVKFVSALPTLGVPGYFRVDTRLGWKVGESVEVSLVGQNLTMGRHIEFEDLSDLFLTTQVAHSVFARVTWRF